MAKASLQHTGCANNEEQAFGGNVGFPAVRGGERLWKSQFSGPAFCNDVESLCLVRECRELEESFEHCIMIQS